MTTATLLTKDLVVAGVTALVASLTANVAVFSSTSAVLFGLALVTMALYEWPWQQEPHNSTRQSQLALAFIMAAVLTLAVRQTAPRGVSGGGLLWTFVLVFLAVVVTLVLAERFQEAAQRSLLRAVPAPAEEDDVRLTLVNEMEDTVPQEAPQPLTHNTPDQRGVCPGQPALPQQAAPLTAAMADVAGDLCYHCPYKVRPGLDCVSTLGAGYNENVTPYSFERYIS